MPDLRVYGTEQVFFFPLVDATSAEGDYLVGTTLVAGDCKVMKDGGTWANTSASVVDEGEGIYSITLTLTEMTAEIILVKTADQSATSLWVASTIIIHTGGHANALHSG